MNRTRMNSSVARGWIGNAAMAVLAGAMLMSPGSAMAQPEPTKLQAPTPGKVPSHPTFMVFAGILLIVVATAGANAIPAKRSHQD
jgi:hypothetical protein